MNTEQTLGIAHFLNQTDAVGLVLFGILIMMSLASWYLIILRLVAHWRQRRLSDDFLGQFWRASSLDEVHAHLHSQGAQEPFGELSLHAMQAQAHHARLGQGCLEQAGSAQDYLTRTIKKSLDELVSRQENGLTVLATVGATAPFVGLFGTVWGVYHALVAIGASGSGSLDKVAGPVGEALIMTGIGLAVAIPAVMGYNWVTRSNRVLASRLDAFAFELFTFLSMGQKLSAKSGGV